MAQGGSATPLIAIDAVALDTETTGLDARKAWIVEIAAARITGGQIEPSSAFRQLVRPGEPIPAAATRIHGIDDKAVAHAPPFTELWPSFATYIGGAVVIGHTIGFDLAVIERECRRGGIAFVTPRALDTRLLAEIVAPQLADHSIESLASWLGIAIVDRHSALGDALLAARIFQALVPKLRERNIRTLAEVERACRALPAALDAQQRAGWIDAAGPQRDSVVAVRVDSYPYRHRIGAMMSTPGKFATPQTTIRTAIERMAAERISSLFVHPDADAGPPPANATAIVTERDIQRLLARSGADAFAKTVGEIATRPLIAVPADAFAFLAMARMSLLRIRHLGVTDAAGRVVGALSARDLLRLRAAESISLGDEIEQAADVPALGRAWAKVPPVVAALRADGLSGRQIAALISAQVCTLTQRAVALAEGRMQAARRGGPPCGYAFAVLGSAGRGESTLALDQDNAVVFADGAPGSETDRWFEAHAGEVAGILHEIGVPYCKGGVMAKNPQWRGSLATWRARVDDWIRRANPQDLLAVDIFFDMQGVAGEIDLIDGLWRRACDVAAGNVTFAKLLVEGAGSPAPGLNLFGGFRTRDGRVDVKRCGLFGVVSTARALAIRHHVMERATPARLAGIKALGIGGESDLDALAEAQATFLDLLAGQQIADNAHGVPPSNAIAVKRLSAGDRNRLRAAFRAVAHLDTLTQDLLFRG